MTHWCLKLLVNILKIMNYSRKMLPNILKSMPKCKVHTHWYTLYILKISPWDKPSGKCHDITIWREKKLNSGNGNYINKTCWRYTRFIYFYLKNLVLWLVCKRCCSFFNNKITHTTLFRNKRFMLEDIILQNAYKFAIFME